MGNQPSTNGADGSAPHGQSGQQHGHHAQSGQHADPRQYGSSSGSGGYRNPNQQPPAQYSGGLPFGNVHNSGVPRTNSDASMTLLDGDKTAAAVAGSDPSINDFLDDDTVPTVFRWEHGGRQVYITGTFNGWSRQIPMHRSGNDFTYIHNLKRGKHAFKFIVDDEWRYAPDQPTVADVEGRINNFIDVTDFQPYTGDKEFEKEKAAAEYGVSSAEGVGGTSSSGTGNKNAAAAIGKSVPDDDDDDDDDDDEGGNAGESKTPGGAKKKKKNKPDKDGEIFSQAMPDFDEYTKEPPPLPPHLRQIILNKPPQLQDTAALVVPQHVALNHLYCTAIRDNMMVLGITQRYKTKFVTTVYYSPCNDKKF